jgi:hypothetical protein
MKRDVDNSPSIGVWALALGGVGFVCGFFGPIELDQDANQGPLLGIFVMGPGEEQRFFERFAGGAVRGVSNDREADVSAQQRHLGRVAAGVVAELSGATGVGGRAGGVSEIRGGLSEGVRSAFDRPGPRSLLAANRG